MSSLVYLGFSLIIFVISYGLMFLALPPIINMADNGLNPGLDDNDVWQVMYDDTSEQVRYLIPLVPSLGIFVIILKVLISSKGNNA